MSAKQRVLWSLVVVTAALASSFEASAGVIRSPTSAVVNDGGTENSTTSPIDNTFNQSGLSSSFVSGTTDFDSFVASATSTHDYDSAVEWFSEDATDPPKSATVTFDLGSFFTIDKLALWNEDSAGIGELDIFYSANSLDFFELLSNQMPQKNAYTAAYPAEVFSFPATNARYVRFAMSKCPSTQDPDPDFLGCAIGEVAFRVADEQQQAPEPATLALISFGLFGAGALRRCRKA